MNTNHQMNYYDYAKTLSAEGVMTALIGGGAGPEPQPELPNSATMTYYETGSTYEITVILDAELSEGYELGMLTGEDSGGTKYDLCNTWNTNANVTYTSTTPTSNYLDGMTNFKLEIKHNGTVCKTIDVTKNH